MIDHLIFWQDWIHSEDCCHENFCSKIEDLTINPMRFIRYRLLLSEKGVNDVLPSHQFFGDRIYIDTFGTKNVFKPYSGPKNAGRAAFCMFLSILNVLL